MVSKVRGIRGTGYMVSKVRGIRGTGYMESKVRGTWYLRYGVHGI